MHDSRVQCVQQILCSFDDDSEISGLEFAERVKLLNANDDQHILDIELLEQVYQLFSAPLDGAIFVKAFNQLWFIDILLVLCYKECRSLIQPIRVHNLIVLAKAVLLPQVPDNLVDLFFG